MSSPAETVKNAKAALRLLELGFWAMIAVGGLQLVAGNPAACTNSLLLAVILRGVRQDMWISSMVAVVGQTLSAPFRMVAAAANDSDPFEGAFQKAAGTEKRDPYGEPFGDMPNVRRPDKDSTKH
jgi:hypothetical protein